MLLCCLRRTLKPSASAIVISKLYQHFRVRDHPYGLQDSLPTLSPSCSPTLVGSAMGPRLDTGGWLTLTKEPLNPSFPTGTLTLLDSLSLSQRDNRDREAPRDAHPPTPPCVRITYTAVGRIKYTAHLSTKLGSPNASRYRPDNANASAGLRLKRHGPCVDLDVFQANARDTPSLRNSR